MYEVNPVTPAAAIASLAREVRGATTTDFPAKLALLADRIDSELADARALKTIADDLAPLARELRCTRVVGASAIGERIAGALLAAHGDALGNGESEPTILIVDGVLTTGTQMERMILKLRDAGAANVVGVVLAGDRDALRRCASDTNVPVRALEEF